jgi:hypothetical protein
MTEHPITPPPELIAKWAGSMCGHYEAAEWGADQELEACSAQISQCCLLTNEQRVAIAEYLHYCRRPTKLPSLKEQALAALHAVATGANDIREQHQDLDTIRKALEALPND